MPFKVEITFVPASDEIDRLRLSRVLAIRQQLRTDLTLLHELAHYPCSALTTHDFADAKTLHSLASLHKLLEPGYFQISFVSVETLYDAAHDALCRRYRSIRRLLRLLNRRVAVILRAMRAADNSTHFVLTESRWFFLHGDHPPHTVLPAVCNFRVSAANLL